MSIDLFGEETPLPEERANKRDKRKNKSGGWIDNPMHNVYGVDQQQRRCKTCIHLYGRLFSKTYYKCDLWSKGTASPSDDHKVNWIACRRYDKQCDCKVVHSEESKNTNQCLYCDNKIKNEVCRNTDLKMKSK